LLLAPCTSGRLDGIKTLGYAPAMKIWLKYLIAAILGVALGLVVPLAESMGILDVLTLVSLNLGRYMLLPILFFSMPIAVHELLDDKKLLRTGARSVAYSVLAVFIMTIIGIAGGLLLSPGRIPLSTDASFSVDPIPTLREISLAMVPANPAQTLLSIDFILPLALLGTMVGLALSFDRSATKPALTLFDSISRISWQINSFFVEILPLPLILISAARTISIARTARLAIFGRMLAVLAIEVVIVVAIVLPLAIYLANGRKNPFKLLYGLLAASLAGAITGHAAIPAGILLKHLKESLGVRRRSSTVSLPLAMTFGRAGTAMVSATTFIVILSSYSSLGIGTGTIGWMLLFIPASALLLGAAPGLGPLSAIAFLCAAYGRGFESGYILVVPVAFPLMALGSFLDVGVQGIISALIAGHEGMSVEKTARHFI
jgi:Na+/H+-dicarboxylate symporter